MSDLAKRSNGAHESGAFIVGLKIGHRREATGYLLYDDLEPGCLDSGIVHFTSKGFRQLWKTLKQSGLQVVADVHTHPDDAYFSCTDRRNPMIPTPGHLAFVIPNYASGSPTPQDAAFFIYKGNYQWEEFRAEAAGRKLYVGFWS